MRIIREGLEVDLDVSIYAKSIFSWQQMKEIKIGLDINLDVSEYAKPCFTEFEMEEIRAELRRKKTYL